MYAGVPTISFSADSDSDRLVPSSLRAPPRQAEIRDDGAHLVLRARRLHEHDVVALEVPVHDPDAVRGREAGGHLPNEGRISAVDEPSIPPEPVGQRLAVQQLHGEKHDLVGRVPVAPRPRTDAGTRRRSGRRSDASPVSPGAPRA